MQMENPTKMYRAETKVGFDQNRRYEPRFTQRLPSNVPYLVDNIWEWLRPEDAPSRRHAVYASPTPELALLNASAGGLAMENYIVCELALFGPAIKVAHLNVTDARLHPDIGTLMRHLPSAIDAGFADLSQQEKQRYAPLFLPGVKKAELEEFFSTSAHLGQLAAGIREISRFWLDASLSIRPDNDGEMFFEIPEGCYYFLHAIEHQNPVKQDQ